MNKFIKLSFISLLLSLATNSYAKDYFDDKEGYFVHEADAIVDGIAYYIYDDHAEVAPLDFVGYYEIDTCLGPKPYNTTAHKPSVTYTGEITVPERIHLAVEDKDLPVTGVGPYAFSYCGELKGVTLPSGITSLSEFAFYMSTDLTKINLQDTNLETIKPAAFSKCHSLAEITLPKTCMDIKCAAFANTALASLTLPASIRYLEWEIIMGCTDLRTLVCEKEDPAEINTDNATSNFWGDGTDCILEVPENSVDLYKATAPWNEFKEIVKIGGSGVSAITDDLNSATPAYYNLAGQRVESPRNGEIIVERRNGVSLKKRF